MFLSPLSWRRKRIRFFAAVVTIMVVARSSDEQIALIDPGQHLKIDGIGPLRDDPDF